MSNEPLNSGAFEAAIRRKDVEAAWDWAKTASRLTLPQALQLTTILGYANDERYQKAVDRLLERYRAEGGPKDAVLVERDLELLGRGGPPPLKYGAGERLLELAAQMG